MELCSPVQHHLCATRKHAQNDANFSFLFYTQVKNTCLNKSILLWTLCLQEISRGIEPVPPSALYVHNTTRICRNHIYYQEKALFMAQLYISYTFL